MARLLAGDIGGTKTLLRLNELTPTGDTTLLYEKEYPSAKFPHLNHIVKQFLKEADSSPPAVACFAIAGPVIEDRSKVTNLSWDLDARQMESELGIEKIRLMNDFVAIGYGILTLQPEDTVVLQDGPKVSEAPIAVLGAGTGLGEALLVWQQGGYEVLATEGGHTDFAARNKLEDGLLTFLRERYGRVSVERVVSGKGIYRIYEYLRDTGYLRDMGLVPSPEIEDELAQRDPPVDPSKVISDRALGKSDRAPGKSDRLCLKALDMFVAAYGAEAGNVALKYLPYGGLYLAGGVGAKILPKLRDGEFIKNFLDKGRMRSLLENIPVSLIVNPKVGLLGAALYAQKLIKPLIQNVSQLQSDAEP